MLKIILTVDNAPQERLDNATNLATAQLNTAKLDAEPTHGSINAVTSGGIFTYCETKPSGVEPKTFTTTVGTEYPGYYLFNSLYAGMLINPDTTKKYAIYRCIEPSECFLQYTPGSGSDDPKWDIKETPSKFEFVRWENE